MNAEESQGQGQSKAGAIGDAPAAFGNALLAAAKTIGTQPAADPRATAAVQLGWVMGSLVTGATQTPLPAGYPIDAVTVLKAKALELGALLLRLAVEVAPGPDALTATLHQGQPPDSAAVLGWESTLVAALLGADVGLAKAYGVGRQLNLLAAGSAGIGSDATTGMVDALDDLTSLLPPHTGRAVINSVRSWQLAAGTPGPNVLRAQCELWRIVLTGEKRATDLLEPENYIDAAEKLAVKFRATGSVYVRQVLGLVVLLLIAVGGLLFVPGAASKVAAGVSGVLVALGLTWSTVGGSFGKLVGRLEAPLWGAELDGAVTEAITLGVSPPPRPPLRERRRRPDGDYAQRTKRRPGIDPADRPGA